MTENELPSTVRDTMKRSGALRLYGLLWFNIADEYWEDEYVVNQGGPEYPIYYTIEAIPLKATFYDNNLIVTSLSKKELRARLGCSLTKLNKAIQMLVDNRWIEVTKMKSCSQCVYVLGKHVDGNISLLKDEIV